MSRRPAVVMVHGTAGIGSVDAFHRQALLDAGRVVLEVDFKTGVYASRMDRPPFEYFPPMAFAALKALRARPSVDPNRIGILGFSLGGGVALRTAVEAERCAWMGQDRGFAAIVAFYPVCKSFIPTAEWVGALTGAPILVAYGTRDAYGEKAAVPELKRVLRERFHFDLDHACRPTPERWAALARRLIRPCGPHPFVAAIGSADAVLFAFGEWCPGCALLQQVALPSHMGLASGAAPAVTAKVRKGGRFAVAGTQPATSRTLRPGNE